MLTSLRTGGFSREILAKFSPRLRPHTLFLFVRLSCRAWLPAELRSQLGLLKIPIQLSVGPCLSFIFLAASSPGSNRTAHLNEASRSGHMVFLFSPAFSQKVLCKDPF